MEWVRTVVSMRSCTPADWAIQSGAKSSLVLSVRIQRYRPMIMLNMAEKVVMTAPSLSQARAWVMMPGRVTRKVTKTKMALAMPAGGWCQCKVFFGALGFSSLTRQGKPLVQEVPSRLSPIFWLLEAHVLDDDGEGEHEDAHEDEEEVAGYVGQSHLVCHRVFGGGGVSTGLDFLPFGVWCICSSVVPFHPSRRCERVDDRRRMFFLLE